MTIAQSLKAQILVNLQALVDAGTIGSFIAVDKGKDPMTIDPENDGGYPLAIVGMPQVSSDFEDQASNLRVYRFDILVLIKYDDTDGATDIEGKLDAILNQFDTNYTLAGAAQAAVLPAEVATAPVSTGDQTLVAFFVSIKARSLFEIPQ